MLDDITSGFTDEIEKEIDQRETMQVENRFGHLQLIYSSEKGYTRLFAATRYGKRYVLKCLKPDYAYTPVYRQALTKEFEIGLTLDHPNICRTIGMEDIPDLGTAIVMEYIDGATLKELIDRHGLSQELSQKLCHQLVDALDYMHSKQVIHRDLKPSNIMVTHNGHNVKVIDFSLSDSDSFNILKQAAGTSGYIAPELLLPEAKASIETDIYSLGIVLRDMATASGNRYLMRIAQRCAQQRAAARPLNGAAIFAPQQSSTLERIAIAVLTIIILLLSFYIATTLYHRANAQPTGIDSVEQTDNRVTDFEEGLRL